ncbi:MAG: hypothetical protein FGF51_04590 [Candidatus Brockarchaeota archaeon]|nr:hypothetical protein [Candidatus Brockarchaeota archaeon]
MNPSSEEIPYIPSIVKNYEIIERLGLGLYSTTYHARRKEDGKDCAIKIFNIEIIKRMTDEQKFGRSQIDNIFVNNRTIMQLLERKRGSKECKNIKQIYYVGSLDEPYVVTEYVTYNLRQYMESRGITHLQAVKIILDVARALLFIFNNSSFYCHADICPDNIYVMEEDNKLIAKLGDFDGAIPEKRSTPPFPLVHKDYCPPGESPLDRGRKFDTYSLGLTLAELIIGEHGRKRIHEDPTYIEEYELPQGIKELIKSATSGRRDRLTLDQFVEELEKVYEQLKQLKYPPPPPDDIKRLVKNVAESYLRILENLKKNPDKGKIENLKKNVDPEFNRLVELWKDEKKRESSEIRNIIQSLQKKLELVCA